MNDTMIIEAVIVGGPHDGETRKFRVPAGDPDKVTRVRESGGERREYSLIHLGWGVTLASQTLSLPT